MKRRDFVIGFVFATIVSGQQTTITARQIVNRIQQHLGVQLPPDTVDTFKAGDPDTPVSGIAVTMMATLDVLQRAAASSQNLVITHEPTFYNHHDTTDVLESQADAVLAEKKKFIAEHHMIVWRFHDGWHSRRPDGILLGMTHALEWERFQDHRDEHLFAVPEKTVGQLAQEVKKKLDIRVLRVVGDPTLKVSNIAFLPGAAGSAKQIKMLEQSNVDVLLIGETPEWETVEYVADAATEGKRKALLILGHVVSEQAGMRECTTWLRSFISGVPVSFVPAAEPFWAVVQGNE